MSTKTRRFLRGTRTAAPRSQRKPATQRHRPPQPALAASLQASSMSAGSIRQLHRAVGNRAVGELLRASERPQQADGRDRGVKPPAASTPETQVEREPKKPVAATEVERPQPAVEQDGTEPVPAAPIPKVEPKPEAPTKAVKPTISHETVLSAPDGSAKNRTNVGVGEQVVFKGSAAGKWTATAGQPRTLAAGDEFTWTAPERAANVTIKLKVGTEEAQVEMKVLEPESITGRRIRVLPIGAGKAGAGMKLLFSYLPKKVSFGNVEAGEVSGPATNISGYYRKHYSDADLWHDSGDHFTPIKENNDDSAQDTAQTTDTFKPYEQGAFDWVIPNRFRVKTETGEGKRFTEVTQSFQMLDDTGRIKITKATAEVERSPNEP